MKNQSIVKRIAQGFILLSAAALLSVSLMAFSDPQSVMDLVHVQLNNTDAFSSIRGIYGGAGLALSVSLIYLMINDVYKGLSFLTLLWGFYALSRVITIFKEGPLGDFGNQWLVTESCLFLVAVALLVATRKSASAPARTEFNPI
jgi:hypothetical protein